jgi:hypothetical protein
MAGWGEHAARGDPVSSYVRIADPFGTELARVANMTGGSQGTLQYVMSVGLIGALTMTLPIGFDDSLLRLDGRVSVWRDVGSARAPYQDGNAEYLIRKWIYGEEQTTIVALHANSLLTTRIIDYYAGTTYTSKLATAADNLIKAFASQNLGSGIVTADRLGAETQADLSAYLSIGASVSLGPSTAKAASWRNLFDVVREICDDATEAGTYLTADISAIDTDSLLFETYTQWRGTDRTVGSGNDLIFSIGRGNLADAQLTVDRTEEITFVTAGGLGESTARIIQTASDDTRMAESPFNRREAFTELTNSADTSQILAIAQARLRAGRPKIALTGRIVETPGSVRGIHYDLGDFVTVELRNQQYNTRLDVISETWGEGGITSDAQFRVNIQ